MIDLYGKELTGLALKPLCGGNQEEEEMDTCVLLGRIPGVPDAFALRDSKNPAARTLRFTGAELRAVGIDTDAIV